MPTRSAPEALLAFIESLGLTSASAANQLKVSKSVMAAWVKGKSVPDAVNRERLEKWTEGAVRADEWDRARMREALSKTVPAKVALRRDQRSAGGAR